MIEAVDLFCGAGGLTHGLLAAGVKVKAGYDLDPACKYPFEKNNKAAKFFHADVASIKPSTIKAHFSAKSVRLLAGCAPCQPFSQHQRGADTSEDPKWSLLDAFASLALAVRPEFVTMENVAPIRRHKIFSRFVEALEGAKYHVSFQCVYCPKYGIPQERRRLVLVASRLGPISLIKPTHSDETFLTVADALKGLPRLAAGAADGHDALHRARSLNELNLKRIRASKPGGTWLDWPVALRAPCHRKKSGESFKSVYARMRWDRPSPTMTTQFYNFGTGRFGHPEQDRSITLREGAILQSFPRTYMFVDPNDVVEFVNVGRLIGNAVPPKLGEAIGKTFVRHLKEHA